MIKFTGIDAYYHMHLIDNLVRNFPHLTGYDPYLIYPGGAGVGGIRFFDWLLASIIWLIGLGSPTEHLIDTISVYFPAILGALVIIPVYFLGKELFGRGAGLLSAGLIAILPGEFLGRSLLGFTDHHVAETLFTTITILFLVLAIKTASQRQLTFNHLKRREWATSTKPVIYSLLAGFFLGIYIFTFQGASLFVFLIFLYFTIQFIIDHLKNKSTDYLCIISVSFFFIPLVTSWLISVDRRYLISLIIALLTPLILNVTSRLMTRKAIKPVYYPLTLTGLGLIGLAIFYLVNPSLLDSMLRSFSVFRPTGASLTTIEMQPIFRPWQSSPLALVWGNFTTSFFLSIIVLVYFIVFRFKEISAEKNLLIVWSLVILAATIGQRRFAYYFAVNVALLSGYLSWQALRLAGFQDTTTVTKEVPQEPRRRTGRPKDRGSYVVAQVNKALAVMIVVLIVYVPNIVPVVPRIATAIATASRPQFAPSDAWISTLTWMKENTPDPFNDPDAYYQLYQEPTEEGFKYPESAYGVSAWWDYGYWITRIAHRIPSANPSQDRIPLTNIANFFISQDANSANTLREELDSSYVIIDYATAYVHPATGSGKFYAVVIWAGKNPTEFFDLFWTRQINTLTPKALYFYPEYYRSLAVRLYNFDGKAVTPETVPVIGYEELTNNGMVFKIITSQEQFDSYQEAEEYISSQESGNYRIVGNNPAISPVPLAALEDYRLVYSSNNSVAIPDAGTIPEVKVFEYIGKTRTEP